MPENNIQNELSFVMIRPQVIEYDLFDKVMEMLYHCAKENNLTIRYLGSATLDDKFVNEHYAQHIDKDFFGEIKEINTDGDSYGFIIEGHKAIDIIRYLVGPTKVTENKEIYETTGRETIRSLFPTKKLEGAFLANNLIHASTYAEDINEIPDIEAYAEFTRFHDLLIKKHQNPVYHESVKILDEVFTKRYASSSKKSKH